MKNIIDLPDIGKVMIRTDRRIKNLSIKMAPTKGVWLNIPFGTKKEVILDFIQKNKAWILENKKKIEQKEQKQTVFTSDTVFHTKFHEVTFAPKSQENVTAKINDSKIEVFYPNHIDVYSEPLQNAIRNVIIHILGMEAEEYLPQRLCELADKYHFRFNKVGIRNSKTHWGSCSGDNNISLSLHLMRLPNHLIDMVLIHELCHTIEKNHSSKFWELHAKCCDNLEAKKQEIKKYSTRII